MALLIYKQWHNAPNRKRTAFNNTQHIKYIGTRPGVLKDNEAESGLFGKIDGIKYNNLEMSLVQSRVDNMSRYGFIIYRSVISIKVDERLNMGFELTKKEQWQKFIEYHAGTIAAKNGINLKNLEYAAAVHQKHDENGDESFHLHFVFWDKNQSVGVNIVDPNIPDEIRKEIENEVADDILRENGYELDSKAGNEVRKALIKGVFSEELNVIYEEENAVKKIIPAITENDLPEIRLINNGINDMLTRLSKNRPRTGANKYAYMPDEFKNELNIFADILIACSPSLKAEIDRYMSLVELRSDIYNSEDSSYGKYKDVAYTGKARDEVNNKIGNKVLQYLFMHRDELGGAGFNYQRGFTQTPQQQNNTSGALELTAQIAKVFKRANQGIKTDLQTKDVFSRGDLSKEAVKDLIYKNEDKGYER